ncbi:MAG: hypothetical protein ISR87_13305 [Candidatus Marinimicrobia bacterium]|nr:hypothetical protein [FCB group bacterium]MBL7026419.1 hypothetical protein [Candidatus Neomarinimicrobiota bacterium]
MNRNKKTQNIDERGRNVIQGVASKMYFLTLQVLVFDMLYRQIFLNQNYRDFEDIAIIVTFNAIVFLVILFVKGGITIPKFKLSVVGGIYGAILLLGSLLGLAMRRFDTWNEYWPYLGRVGGVSAILLVIYGLSAWAGNRRLDKLADDAMEE